MTPLAWRSWPFYHAPRIDATGHAAPSKRRLGLAEQVEDEVFGKPPKSLEHAHFKPSTHFLLDHRKMFGQSRGSMIRWIATGADIRGLAPPSRYDSPNITPLLKFLELLRTRRSPS